ncbi:MAG: hypothetical protein PUA56_05035 [Bacillales bacterium]|nr:hypothetical protein [Bacillales bacterium]
MTKGDDRLLIKKYKENAVNKLIILALCAIILLSNLKEYIMIKIEDKSLEYSNAWEQAI